MSILLQPIVFFCLLFVILAIAAAVMLSGSRDQNQRQQDLNSALNSNADLEKKVKNLEEEIKRLNSELTLKNQMFEGLKGQYAELEEDFQKMAQKAQEQAPVTPQTNNPKPGEATDSGSPLIKII